MAMKKTGRRKRRERRGKRRRRRRGRMRRKRRIGSPDSNEFFLPIPFFCFFCYSEIV